MSVALLIIDPQRDFCDPEQGSLAVPGADQDMIRLANLVRRCASEIDAIHVTLDTHHFVDIAHPIFWSDADGRHPAPFTILTADDVASGRWRATKPEMQERASRYVTALEQGGRYQLCIWPYHCLLGSEGHAVYPELFAALQEWEQRFAIVNYIPKGSNIYTEHYSAIQAEVPDPNDLGTQPNLPLIETLRQADRVLIAGEAGSHCVANTVRDLTKYLQEPGALHRLCLLTDAISPVPGYERYQVEFLRDMDSLGVQTATTETAFAA